MFKNRSCLKSIRYCLTKNSIHKLLSILFIVIALNTNAATYYVSSSGSDSNPGTSENQAWKSLMKVNSFTPRTGDQILFRRGDSWVGTLTVNASGTAGSPIIYGAYGTGSKPIIYGSEQITGWTLHSGKIYKAQVSKNITQLFLDDSRMKVARNINSNYVKISTVISPTAFTSSDLNSGINYTGSTWIGRTNEWSISTKSVKASSGSTVQLESEPEGGLKVGNGFCLLNKAEFLDSPGEWFFDKNTGMVYFWTPTGNSPAPYEIRGTTVNDNVVIDRKNYVTVRELDLRHAAQRGIIANRCAYLTIDNNRISSPDLEGILITNGESIYNTVTNNNIDGANHHGIKVWTSYSMFSNNTITNTAMFNNLGLTGMGVSSEGRAIDINGDGNTLRYNRIIGSGYLGIGLYQAPGTLIEYNFIQDVCLDKEDGGGIYMWESNVANEGCAGTVIRNNIVINAAGSRMGLIEGYRPAGYGIFLDDNIRDVLIENNTISNCGSTSIFLHLNKNITVQNNTTFWALRRSLLISGDYGGSKITNNTFHAQDKAAGDWLVPLILEQINGNASFSNNKYIAHYSTKTFRHQHDDYTFNEWKSSGQDANSYVDHSPLATGEKEELFYNDAKQTKTLSLGGYAYRDIYGTELSSSITLEPFTSKILIKTTKVVSGTNQSPVIQDQMISTTGGKQTGEFVGQVIAYDPDAGQTLNYAIVQDNSGGYFTINSSNGKLTANKPFPASGNHSVVLRVSVTDNAPSPLSANANITINITESIANQSPVIQDQTISTTVGKQVGEFVGQVVASDSDAGQTLNYAIVQDNSGGYFAINASNGKLSANKPFPTSGNYLVVLRISVTDNTSSPLSASANITINITESIANQSPVIQEQIITTTGGKKVGEFVGQVVANDPDAGQTLNYAIVQDSSGGYLAINASNGKLAANKPFPSSGDHSVVLRISVTDNSSSPLSASANVTVNVTNSPAPDYTAPVVSSFSLPSSSASLTVSVLSFNASDNQEVTGYKLTETSTKPTAGSSEWTVSAPQTYTFAQSGTKTLYAWSKDAAGNVSNSMSATVTITIPVESSSYSEYLMEEPSGSKVYDSQGANHGTIMNSVIRTFGVKGSGVGIDGTNYINLGQVFGENVTDEVSVSVWIKPMTAVGDWQGIVVHGGPNFNTFGLYIRPSSKEIGFKTTGTTSDVFTTTAGSKLWDGNWHQLTATYDGTKKVIYLDDVAIKSINASGNINSGKGYNLSIGAVTEQASPNSFYYGYIDEVRIFNYVLGSLDVNNLYASVNNLKAAGIPGANHTNAEGLTFIGSTKNGSEISIDASFIASVENDFKLYPNPANEYIQIDYSFLPELETAIVIVDGTGRTVLNQTVVSTVNRIDISSLSPGMYYVKSVNQQSSTVKKLIVNNY